MRLISLILTAAVFCSACTPKETRDVISNQNKKNYQCGVSLAGFKASVVMNKSALQLVLEDFEIENNEPQSPYLEFQDLMQVSDTILFEATDSDTRSLAHTWQLLQMQKGDNLMQTQSIDSSVLKTKNLHVSVVRIAFHSNGVQNHNDEHKEDEHDHSEHDHHDHAGHDEHDNKEKEEVYEGPMLSFGVYQQLRGQSKPTWCKVTVPVEIEKDEDVYQIQILKADSTFVKANSEHGHQGHSHDH